MSANFQKAIRYPVRYWYLPTIGGMVFIALGILMFYTIPECYRDLGSFFSLVLILSGLSESLFAVLNRKKLAKWGWLLAIGSLTMLSGILIFYQMEPLASNLPVTMGCVLLCRSLIANCISLGLRNYNVKEFGKLLAIGLPCTGFSFLLLINSGNMGFSIITWTGLALISLGLFNIYSSLIIK